MFSRDCVNVLIGTKKMFEIWHCSSGIRLPAAVLLPQIVTQSRLPADSDLVLFSSPNPIDPDEPLTRFLEMLPPLPTPVTAFNASVGTATVLLATVDRGRLIGYGPQTLMEDGLDLVVEIRDEHGAGRDVLMQVSKSFYQVDGQTMLYLQVVGFENRAGKREVARTPLEGDAYASVLWSARLPVGDQVHVWLADISENAIAFLTELACQPGDELMITISVGDRPVTMEARVRRVDPAPLARNRVAADLRFLHEWDKAAVGRLAGDDCAIADPDPQRQPDVGHARAQSRAEQHQLQARLAIRRYKQTRPVDPE